MKQLLVHSSRPRPMSSSSPSLSLSPSPSFQLLSAQPPIPLLSSCLDILFIDAVIQINSEPNLLPSMRLTSKTSRTRSLNPPRTVLGLNPLFTFLHSHFTTPNS